MATPIDVVVFKCKILSDGKSLTTERWRVPKTSLWRVRDVEALMVQMDYQ